MICYEGSLLLIVLVHLNLIVAGVRVHKTQHSVACCRVNY